MPVIYENPDITEKKKYKGEAEASQAEKDAVGGEKMLQVNNHLFQSDADAQDIADALLARLKDRKQYFEISSEFCPVPLERRDTITAKEYISPTKSITHQGLVREVRLTVTPQNQTLTLIIEE